MPSDAYQIRCRELLDTALEHVQAYESWRAFDPGPSADIDARYAAMPAITKRELRAHFPNGFVKPERDVDAGLRAGEIEYVATSGTTDEKVTNIWHQAWWNASEKASWALNAHTSHLAGDQREAILASPLSVGFLAEHGSFPQAKRTLGRFLFLNETFNPADWTDQTIDRMIDELAAFKPETLEANPSLISRFCRRAAETGRQVFQPRAIILTYEFCSAIHLRTIQRVFSCPVVSSYGSTEAGYVFMECEHGKLHQNTEFCRVDFLPWKHAAGGPALGRMLVSTFHNPWMVLLRFDIGDIGRRAHAPCPCGRTEGITLDAIEGRAKNITIACDGTPVTERAVDLAICSVGEIEAYQLEQSGHDTCLLRVVCDDGAVEPNVIGVLKDLYGRDADILVERVPRIDPSPSGKFRLIIPGEPVDPLSLVEEPAR